MPVFAESDLSAQLEILRKSSKKIGFTCGAFDLLHPGHVRYLREARKLCDYLVVAINDDESVRRLKGEPLPLIPGVERAELVDSLRWVDAVLLMPDDRPLRLIELFRPDLYLKGGDYRVEKLRSAEALKSWGGEARVLSVDSSHSSSALRERIRQLPSN